MTVQFRRTSTVLCWIFIILSSLDIISANFHNTGKTYLRRGKAYPPIGRLFEADLPSDDDIITDKNKITYLVKPTEKRTLARLNNRNIRNEHLETNLHTLMKNFYSLFNIHRKVQNVDEPKQDVVSRRLKRAKGVILGGEKFTTDYYQDKIKRSDYEFRKKSVVRGEIKQNFKQRSKRNANESFTIEINNNINTTDSHLEERNNSKTTNKQEGFKRDYAQRLFQKRIEALFDTNYDKESHMKKEEIEKSKILRKELLNYYIKNKQRKTAGTFLPVLNYTKEDKQPTGGKELSRHLRLSVDIPVDEIDDIEDLFEDDDEYESTEGIKTDTEGRSRRRKLRRFAIPILLALKLKTLLFAPVIFGIVSLIAFKGLWAGMTALGVVSALALKSVFSNQVKIMYEMRPPYHHHYPPMGISEIHHGYPEYWRREDSYKPIGGWR